MTEIIVNLKTNQTLLIILDPIRLQNGPRLIADLSFYATVPFFDSSRRWQFHEKKNTKIPWKPWDIPNLFEFMADDISTNGPRRINSYVKNNPYLKQMDNSWQQHYLFDDTKTESGILRPWYLVTKKQNVIPIN